ncbi:type III secretion system outer membrane ring subunit SctC [Caldimonas brevitalea]|uniref:Type 3 secretion system secretin n=1 Tax=Caldimonas brevitalea TaxID=413882 RepID=A0A0G3BMT4_9BURK|nr:type III secretion system outer membrane ring subunit SctC [Caldimonas brevitalea]AKJ27835.1 type III secretion outermembrane pore forming protein [Caldimonas brevitalea]
MRLLAKLIASCLLATAALPPAFGETAFSNKRFVYRADGKKLNEVFQDFAASQSLPLVIDDGVAGTVNAEFNAKPEEFLNAMSRTYGVIWYFDGTTLFIYPSKAMSSRVFRMRGYDRAQVREMLKSLGLGDARFPLRFNEAEQTLLAYGPPRHIELVSTVIDTLERSSRDRIGKAIQVFPLKYAYAADRMSGSTRIPGLASTLNNIFSGNERSGSGLSESKGRGVAAPVASPVDKRRSAEELFGIRPPDYPAASPSASANPAAKTDPSSGGSGNADPERPFFQADEATNSIIVRAMPERMKQYETLIQQLDVAQDLVEIEATIIDVSTDEFESLGIEWDFTREGRGRITVSPGAPASNGQGTSTALGGANITTVVGDAGRALLTRIKALEGNGKARILARPKVLGAANRMASMVDKRVASVRVAGNLDANLFTIEAGTSLEVLPQIVMQPDRREVRLSLFIEDGSFEGAVVDQVPIIKRTEIRTEATIREGESLLVGGISVESDSKGRTGLPGLSRIPLIGAAFRHDENVKTRSERLFLLTPKVISVAQPAKPAPVPSIEPPAGATPAPQAYGAAKPAARLALSEPVQQPVPAPVIPVAATQRATADCPAAALGLSTAACATSARGAR